MKTAIVYLSQHHGNTKKLLDAIAVQGDVTLFDAGNIKNADLKEYEVIGFASGIYYQKFHESVLKFAEKNLPPNKKVFFIYTCGIKRNSYTDAIRKIAEAKKAQIVGSFDCPGFDTFGPFKLVGGIAKGRPNEEDVQNAVEFYTQINKA